MSETVHTVPETSAEITANNTTEKNMSTADDTTQEERPSNLSHASRRVIIHNIYKWMNNKNVEKLIQSIIAEVEKSESIKVEKFKKAPKADWVAVTLENEDMAQKLVDAVNNGSHKKQKAQRKPMFARLASDNGRDNSSNKRSRDSDRDGNENNKRGKVQETLDEDGIRDKITPLWRKPYEAQLIWKRREMIQKCTKKVMREIDFIFRQREKEAKRNKDTKLVPKFEWLKKEIPVEISPILPSPNVTEYRNKVEFSFGLSSKEKPIVGFTPQGWNGPVYSPHCCQNTPREALGVANIVDKFLSTSPLPPYQSRLHRGVWRTLTMRFSKRTNECMLIILHAPPSGGAGKREDGQDDYSEQWESEKKRLIQMLTEDPISLPHVTFPDLTQTEETIERENILIAPLPASSTLVTSTSTSDADSDVPVPVPVPVPFKVTSIYFQEYEGLSTPSPEHPVQLEYGSGIMKERLGQCEFQISPGAFFQVNTEAAEVLYNVAVEKVKEVTCAEGANPKNALLLDVCCGTGTIGLTCMKEGAVGKVVGVDISEPAIKDAEINAELNGYKNESQSQSETIADFQTKFIASRAEAVLAKELSDIQDKPAENKDKMIVAVVDPAREGLHNTVLRTLRVNEAIKRLVYVSCNPSGSLVKDAAVLCQPTSKKYGGRPFKISSAQPVDMFPLTNHCEMVMVFDRMSKDECSKTEQEK